MHAGVAVRRLSLSVPPGRTGPARQRIEDALDLAAAGERRLLVLRHLALGRMHAAAPAATWQARAAGVLADRRARAVHGGAPGAEAADAVWFRSAEEARALLLLLLAGGQAPTAWFWRLAVPDFRGAALGPWLAHALARADADPTAAVALAHAVVAVARAGRLARLFQVLADAVPALSVPAPSPPVPAARPASPARAEGRAAAVLGRLSPDLARAMEDALAPPAPHTGGTVRLVRLLLLAAAPELAGATAELTAVAEAVLARLRAGEGVLPHAVQAPGQAPPRTAPGTARRAAPGNVRAEHAAPAPRAPADRPDAPHEPAASPSQGAAPPRAGAAAPRLDGTAQAEDASEEQLSRAAGALLAVRALDRMGLGARIAAAPDLAAAGFGRWLLRHLAARARIPPHDPLHAALAAGGEPPPSALLDAWRTGLDRWLRRRARLTLSQMVLRRGWLSLSEVTLTARFPLAAADLRLRRLALDVDPGWVPWLGLRVLYRFTDEAGP